MPSSSGRSGARQPARRNRPRRSGRAPRTLRTVEETSAGGLVLDPDHTRAVVIGRLDRRDTLLWSLPKGHIEPGETAEQTAMREVEEETGVTSKVLRPLGTIDYWFVADNHKKVHKTVHHFILEWLSGELSDEDVEVTEVAWFPLAELPDRLAYPDERKLLAIAMRLLRGAELSGDQHSEHATEADRP